MHGFAQVKCIQYNARTAVHPDLLEDHSSVPVPRSRMLSVDGWGLRFSFSSALFALPYLPGDLQGVDLQAECAEGMGNQINSRQGCCYVIHSCCKEALSFRFVRPSKVSYLFRHRALNQMFQKYPGRGVIEVSR